MQPGYSFFFAKAVNELILFSIGHMYMCFKINTSVDVKMPLDFVFLNDFVKSKSMLIIVLNS